MFHVEDLMTRELITLHPEDDLARADTVMKHGRIRHLPVVDAKGRLLGLVTHRDLLRVFADQTRAAALQVPAGDVMTVGVTTVTPGSRLSQALEQMVENKFGCLPVVDGEGVLVGLLTQFDLLKFAARVVRDLDEVEKIGLKVRG